MQVLPKFYIFSTFADNIYVKERVFSDLAFEQAEIEGLGHQIFTSHECGITLRTHESEDDKALSISLEFSEGYEKEAVDRGARYLKNMLDKQTISEENVLIVGIGNGNMTSDSLGQSCIRLVEGSSLRVKTLLPGVKGVTGIDSDLIVRSVAREIGADIIIAVDSLCARAYRRIGRVIQITERGITAGSALGTGRAFNRESLGVPVIGIGLPVVVSARALIEEFSEKSIKNSVELSTLLVAPKEIDLIIEQSSKLLSEIIIQAFSN